MITANREATGEILLSYAGLLGHVCELHPACKYLHHVISAWLGHLNKRCWHILPACVKQRWKQEKRKSFEVPAQIIGVANQIIEIGRNETVRAIDLVLDPLDAILVAPKDTDCIDWQRAAESKDLCRIIAYANHTRSVGNASSTDSSPEGTCTVSPPWGPQIEGEWSRQPGDFVRAYWKDVLSNAIKQSSTAFEICGSIFAFLHPWFSTISEQPTRGKKYGAKAVAILFKDNKADIGSVNRDNFSIGYAAPAIRFRHHCQKHNMKVFAFHLGTKIIPADIPSRFSESNEKMLELLRGRLALLGLDPNGQGKEWPAPSGWRKEFQLINRMQANYRHFEIPRPRP